MHEQLLGYLLGSLDPSEHEEVAQRLRRDPRLHEELERLEVLVARLKTMRHNRAAPPDLAQRVCDHVEAHDRQCGSRQRGSRQRGSRQCGSASAEKRAWSAPQTIRWTVTDALVAAGLLVVGAALLLPVIAKSRYLAQLAACQNNLRQLGTALHEYSELHGGQFPQVPAQGKLAVAGMYAPILKEHELIPESRIVLCPGSSLAHDLADSGEPFEVYSCRELESANGRRCERLRNSLGGSYAYTIGFVSDGVYHSTRNQGRGHFPILADAPAAIAAAMQSPNHGGRGQNVLFEDMHVRFVRGCTAEDCDDHIFLNRNGVVEAGLDVDDAVLAPSGVSPLPINGPIRVEVQRRLDR